MAIHFKDTEASVVSTLQNTAESLKGRTITIRELLEAVGEQGLLLFCSVLTLPFLFPISIPGVSTVFGLIITLIGVGVTLNRVPWLPSRLMQRTIKSEHIIPALEKGVSVFGRLENWVKPRLGGLSSGVFNRLNGMALTLSAILLLFPLSLIPFSNTLPAVAILCLAFGMLQRDGYFIILGYIALVATIIYFGVLAAAALMAGQAFFS